MKGPVLAVLFLFVVAYTALAQPSFEERMAIKETVAKWNSSLHITTIPQLNNLYASSVLSYGKYRTRDACIKEKSDAVNQFAGFHQEIITPLEITTYKSGTFKCSFTKRVRYKERVEEYPGYLLLQKVGDRYQITGESDLKTDSLFNVQLDLGEAISPKSPKSDSYWVIFCAASLLLLVVIIWMMGKSQIVSKSFVHPKTSPSPVPIKPAEKLIEKTVAQKPVEQNQSRSNGHAAATAATSHEEDTGRAFEQFILDKFPKDRFNLVEWRSDKSSNGKVSESSRWPDLQLELNLQDAKHPFAVECKWRNDFWKGIIEWARDAQISTYQEFQLSRDMPVFIALGVGGSPSDPRDLFIIPLSHLYKTILTEDWLKKYKRESRDNFFLNLDPIALK